MDQTALDRLIKHIELIQILISDSATSKANYQLDMLKLQIEQALVNAYKDKYDKV